MFGIDCLDVDALVAGIVLGNHDPLLDLTADGLVNHADLEMWRTAAGAAQLASGNAYLPGDANLDGVVDASDFNAWNNHKFTAAASWCAGDFNADGQVDASDFNIWNNHKFTTADTTAVPEPASQLLTALAASTLLLALNRSTGDKHLVVTSDERRPHLGANAQTIQDRLQMTRNGPRLPLANDAPTRIEKLQVIVQADRQQPLIRSAAGTGRGYITF